MIKNKFYLLRILSHAFVAIPDASSLLVSYILLYLPLELQNIGFESQ